MPESVLTHTMPLLLAGGVCCWVVGLGAGAGLPAGVEAAVDDGAAAAGVVEAGAGAVAAFALEDAAGAVEAAGVEAAFESELFDLLRDLDLDFEVSAAGESVADWVTSCAEVLLFDFDLDFDLEVPESAAD